MQIGNCPENQMIYNPNRNQDAFEARIDMSENLRRLSALSNTGKLITVGRFIFVDKFLPTLWSYKGNRGAAFTFTRGT